MSGVLYVVATPIGNLEDWSQRARRVLAEVDLLLCEDTRHSIKLLNRYGIQVPLESYHDFNQGGRAEEILARLQAGRRVALVSDQGTPTVSDPGYRLVALCRQRGVPVLPVPGPSAAVAALSVSGLPTDEFCFVGFLPPRKEARRRKIATLARGRSTLVFYEAPHRLVSALDDMEELLGNRTCFVAREMTKLYETYHYGRISEVKQAVRPQGELVIVIAGNTEADEQGTEAPDLTSMTRQETLKIIARQLRVSRRDLYEALYKKQS